MNAQSKPGYFGPPLKGGEPLARQRGMADKINKICRVLEGLRGIDGVAVIKSPLPDQWIIRADGGSGGGEGLPEGFGVLENAIVDMRWMYPEHADGETGKYEIQVKRGKVLVKDAGDWETAIEFAKYDA